jgi:putative Holliday junction resolvase
MLLSNMPIRTLWYTRPMKYLGIDYGHKRIGLALSDGGMLAAPFSIIESEGALENITAIIRNNGINIVVIGESTDNNGSHNPIHKEAKKFVEALSQQTGVPHIFVKEFFSSVAARGHAGKQSLSARQSKQNPIGHADAKAAAVILQRYLDTLQ